MAIDTSTPPSLKRLASLRPSDSLHEVALAYGDRWQKPRPHRAGRVLRLMSTHGVAVDIDAADRLGQIQYDWRFAETIPVANLKIGMARAEVLTTLPGLKPSSMPMASHLEFASTTTPDGHRMFIELHTGKVSKIAFDNPLAVYPPQGALILPAASGLVGAPFADGNFKLAVLSALMAQDEIDLGDPTQFLTAVSGQPVDIDVSGYELQQAAYDYLVRFPLEATVLDKVTDLTLDAGGAIYEYIWPFWDGECRTFDIQSFAGIQHLRHLQRLVVISLADMGSIDRAPLELLPGLKIR